MEKVATSPLEQAVDRSLEGLDSQRAGIREAMAKTDADFIDENGDFNGRAKESNKQTIFAGVGSYNQGLRSWDLTEEEQKESGLTSEQVIALRQARSSALSLPEWEPRMSKKEGQTFLGNLASPVAESRESIIETAQRMDRIFEWWRNPAPALLVERRFYSTTDTTHVSVFPGKGAENIRIINKSVAASLNDGVRVSVTTEDGVPTWLNMSCGDVFHQTLVGNFDSSASSEERTGPNYDDYAFISESDVSGLKSDVRRFAARVALPGVLGEGKIDVPLPMPSISYRTDILKLLARSTVAAFMPAELEAEVIQRRSSMVGNRVEAVHVTRTPNLIRSSTEAELSAYLYGVGFRLDALRTLVQAIINDHLESDNLGQRIDAGRALEASRTFFANLGLNKSTE